MRKVDALFVMAGLDLQDRVLVSSDDLAIFDIEAVVESDASEDEVLLSFEARVSDRLNPQAEFENVTCEIVGSDSSAEVCSQIKETYFSKLIRKF